MQLNRVSAGGLGQVFSRIFGLADDNGIQTVAPEIMPTTSPWERDEFWALTGGNLCAWGEIVAAGGAGTFAAVQLRNPTGSGMILITDALLLSSAITAWVGFNLLSGLTTLATSDDSNHREGRRAPGGNVIRGIAGQVRFSTEAATIIPQQFPIFGPIYLPVAWVIPPGFGLQIATPTANTQMMAGFLWREKPVASAEQLTY